MPVTEDISPPEQSVWTKYSPNHEFPVATAVSLLIHGMLVGGAILVFLWLNSKWHGESSQPVEVKVAYVKGSAGTGQAGGGGGGKPAGEVGSPEEAVKLETPAKQSIDYSPIAPPIQMNPIPVKPIDPDFPVISEPNKIDFDKQFADADKNFKPVPPAAHPGPRSSGGGNGGIGSGTGTGNGPGNGPGLPGPVGIPGEGLTRAQILAQRWHFDFHGSSHESIQKLIAVGVKFGFTDRNNLFWMIDDLKRRPVMYKLEPFEKYANTVKWFSQNPASVLDTARELQLPAPPKEFVILLPQDKEQTLADIELAYAKSRGYDVKRVRETWFDFQVVRGAITPVVRAQLLFD